MIGRRNKMQLHVTLKIQQRREKVYLGGINGFVSGEVKCSHNLPLNFGAVRTKKKKTIMGKRISNY